jgi:flavin reductase (DIM6/NTAB) family NADH-FMN oxidoreductase RutF
MHSDILDFDGEETVDPRRLRSALGRYPTGVTVITTRTGGGKLEGMTANSFAAVSLDPPLVLWSIERRAASLPGFLDSGCFAINILSSDQSVLARHFAVPRMDKFEGIEFAAGIDGCPLLPDALASFECSIENTAEGGDHVIVIGRVRRAAYREGQPLIFSSGRYGTHAAMTA